MGALIAKYRIGISRVIGTAFIALTGTLRMFVRDDITGDQVTTTASSTMPHGASA